MKGTRTVGAGGGERAVDRVVDSLYDAVAQPTLLPDALRRLADFVDAHSALLILEDPLRGRWTGLLSKGSDERLVSPESMGQAPDNPWTQAAMRQPLGTVLLTDQLVPRRELERSAFYARVVRPLQIEHGMGCVFRVHGQAHALLVAHRSARQGPFPRAVVARYRALVPHLERACRLIVRFAEAEAGRAAARAALHRLRVGVVVVDQHRHVCFANHSAARALEEGTAVAVQDGRLVAAAEAGNRKLERLIAAAVDNEHPGAAATVRCLRCGRPVELLVMPMLATAPLPGPSAPAALVLFRNHDEKPEGLEALLEQLYQLTPTEARVARAILGGKGVKQAAEALGIGVSTAKTHLYRVFEKTGTRRQAELVRLLLDGPALLCGWSRSSS